jgi:hypothetical protein
MRLTFLVTLAALAAALLIASPSAAQTGSSWLFEPSTYSHDPQTGQRVNQFAQPAPAYVRFSENYLQSGYRHNTISIQAGDGSDHLHVVETWGAGDAIRPYGEWLRPFRPGATPYGVGGYPQGQGFSPNQGGGWNNPSGFGSPAPNPWGAQSGAGVPTAPWGGAPGAQVAPGRQGNDPFGSVPAPPP